MEPLFYDFAFSPTLGPVEAISFQLISEDPVTEELLSFTPFSVTVGTSLYTIEQGAAGLLNIGGPDIRCFAFGTANTVLGPDSCGIGIDSPPDLGCTWHSILVRFLLQR